MPVGVRVFREDPQLGLQDWMPLPPPYPPVPRWFHYRVVKRIPVVGRCLPP